MNKDYNIAKKYSLIPIITLCILLILFYMILLFNGGINFIGGFALIVVILIQISSIPIFILGLLAVKHSLKIIKENKKVIMFLIFGIIDIIIAIYFVFLSLFLITSGF